MFTPIISGLSLYDITAYFILYAVIGFMLEVVYAALVLGKFVNRGFLNGPWCPIYGFGMVIVALTLKPVSGNLIALFIGSVIVTSVIEFVTGYVLERVFNQKWWDYTEEPFNLGGYICLKFSLIWGVACVFVVELILPLTDALIGILPHTVGLCVFVSVIVLMLTDLASTVTAIVGVKRKLILLSGIAERLRSNSDGMGEFISDETLELRQKFDSLSASLADSSFSRRIKSAFPKLEKESIENKLAELRSGFEENLDQVRVRLAELRDDLGERIDKPTTTSAGRALLRTVITLAVGIAVGMAIGYLLAMTNR